MVPRDVKCPLLITVESCQAHQQRKAKAVLHGKVHTVFAFRHSPLRVGGQPLHPCGVGGPVGIEAESDNGDNTVVHP